MHRGTKLLLTFAGLVLATAAQAADKYMIASVVGDAFTVTRAQMQTGSNIDTNKRYSFELPKNALDDQVVLSVQDVIRRACGACDTTMVRVNPALFADANEGAVPAAVMEAARQAGAQRLVLLTKHRGETQLKVRDGRIGQGRLRGLGFYIDSEFELIDQQTRERSEGFLAPYAYFRMQVIDVAQGVLLLNKAVRASAAIAVPRLPDGSIWNAVSAEDKTKALLALVRDEVSQALPAAITR